MADEAIGDKIAEAMEVVGKDGVITVEKLLTFGIDIDTVEGMQFDKGFINPFMMLRPHGGGARGSDILIAGSKVGNIQDLLPVLEKVMQAGKQLLIGSPGRTGARHACREQAARHLHLRCGQGAGFGDRRKRMLEDIAIVTGGQVVTEEPRQKLENATLEMLGRAEKVKITKDDTNDKGAEDAIKGRIGQAKYRD